MRSVHGDQLQIDRYRQMLIFYAALYIRLQSDSEDRF